MIEFTVKNAAGIVLRSGKCLEEHFDGQVANPGETVVRGILPFPDPTIVLSWRAERKPEYPPLEDLADAIYHQAKGNNGPMNAYIARCDAVKTKIRKPT